MRATEQTLEAGETLELGTVEHIEAEDAGGKVTVRALWTDEPSEHVLLEQRVEDGDEVDLHSRAMVLAFMAGSGMGSTRVVYILPTQYYGE